MPRENTDSGNELAQRKPPFLYWKCVLIKLVSCDSLLVVSNDPKVKKVTKLVAFSRSCAEDT